MSSSNNPSLNPSNNDTLAGVLQFVWSKYQQQVNGMLPAQVIAYDRTTNRVQVQLLISMITTDGTIVPRSQLASVPTLILGGGGYLLNFPLTAGDLGWVQACDRDISLFTQSYTQSPPNTARMFDFADSLFIPDMMTGYTIAVEDAENFVIQNLDGTVKISLTPAGVVITGGLSSTDGISITGGGGITVTGNLNLTGTIAVTGNITATGSITPFV